MAKKKGKKKKATIHIPGMADVEARQLVDEGQYLVEVTNVEQKPSDSSEHDYLNWEFTISKGDFKGQKLWNITSFSPKSLWVLKNLLIALDAEVPDEPEDVEVESLLGLELLVSVEHQLWEGTNRAKVVGFKSAEDSDEEDVEVEDDDDEQEKLSEEAIREMDEDELKDVVEKYELGIKLTKKKTLRKKQSAVVAAMEEEGHISDDDEDDEDDD